MTTYQDGRTLCPQYGYDFRRNVTAHTTISPGRFNVHWSGFLHAAYTVYILITLGGVAIAAFALPKPASDIWLARIVVVGVFALLIFLVLVLLVLGFKYSRKARYAETLGNLHDVHHMLRDLLSEIRSHSGQGNLPDTARSAVRHEIEQGFQRVLTQLVLAFGLSTGVRCRASIKLIGVLEGKAEALEHLYVRTFARDAASAHECADKDKQEGKQLQDHLVIRNTDYSLLVDSSARFYFSDNIAKEENYRNTSDEYWNGKRPLQALVRRAGKWFETLEVGAMRPFLSVMTFPIRVTRPDAVGQARPIIGFLCVDAGARSAFWRRYDPNLGAAISDSLYHPLREYGELMLKTRN